MLGYQPDDDWSRPDKSDDNTGDKSLSRWWALPTLVVGAFITFLVHQVASFARAEAAGICSGVLFIVIVSIWRFHRERWFWPFLIGTAVFEGIAIWLIPWPPNHEFQKSDLNFIWVDWLLLFGAASLIDHFVETKK